MKNILSLMFLILVIPTVYGQSYMKVVIDRGSLINNCDTEIELIPYLTNGPYVITWWDNSWQPSTGFHAENVCENVTLTTEMLDINCNHLRAATTIMPDSLPQIYLDTVIAVLPSAPGMCDGSITFKFNNVSPSHTRSFSSSGSGGITTDSVFTNLCEDYYTYGISQGGIILGEVTVSLHYSPLNPCEPFTDSLILTPPLGPGQCNGSVTYNSSGTPGSSPYYHSIYKPVGGGSVQVAGNDSLSFDSLCSGPHIVRTETYGSNNYFVSNTIYVDNPLINDSTWGTPGSGQIDTVFLSAITNCGINYSFDVDSVYISNMNHIANNQYEFEITVLQIDSLFNHDTIRSYETAFVDTSHQLCFDITFFCSDSSNFKTVDSEIHNYIFFPDNQVVTSVPKNKSKDSMIQLFPNPTRNNLIISNLPPEENNVSILTLEGKIIQQLKISDTSFEIVLENVPQGLYFLRIENEGNVDVRKFIVMSK
jgi:hypothetical protein